MNKLTVNNFLLILLTSLVAKSIILSNINIAEALVCISVVGFAVFNKYLEYHKPKVIEKDFENRIKDIENKLSYLNLGRSINNRK